MTVQRGTEILVTTLVDENGNPIPPDELQKMLEEYQKNKEENRGKSK